MGKHLVSVVVSAAALVSAGCASGPDGYGAPGPYAGPQYGSGCYPGERAGDCRERLRYEQRTNQRYVWRDGRYERYDSGDVAGAAIAAGILGFILGAAIAGSDDDRKHYERNRNDRDWRRRCAEAHPGFDPRSGTYPGPDGLRRYCTR
jgi:hypothetical protein